MRSACRSGEGRKVWLSGVPAGDGAAGDREGRRVAEDHAGLLLERHRVAMGPVDRHAPGLAVGHVVVGRDAGRQRGPGEGVVLDHRAGVEQPAVAGAPFEGAEGAGHGAADRVRGVEARRGGDRVGAPAGAGHGPQRRAEGGDALQLQVVAHGLEVVVEAHRHVDRPADAAQGDAGRDVDVVVVPAVFFLVVVGDGELFAGLRGVAPAQQPEAGVDAHRPLGVGGVLVLAGALVGVGPAGLEVDAVGAVGAPLGVEGGDLGVAPVVDALRAQVVVTEAVVVGARDGEAHRQVVELAADAGAEIVDAVVAGPVAHGAADGLGGRAGDDVGHAEEGIAAVGRGVGAAEDFDALDVVDVHADLVPLDSGDEVGRVDRAAVHLHQHPPRRLVRQAVVGDQRLVAGVHPELEAGHQAEQFVDVARPGGADHLAVEHRDGARRVGRRLGQAGGRQHHRQVAQVVGLADVIRVGKGCRWEERDQQWKCAQGHRKSTCNFGRRHGFCRIGEQTTILYVLGRAG